MTVHVPWTLEETAHFRQAWANNEPLMEMSEQFGRTVGSLVYRAKQLKLWERTLDEPISRFVDEGLSIQFMDDAFIAAMTKAIEAGKETAPIGIDTRPGTKKPVYIDPRRVPANSLVGSAADYS